MGLLSADTRRDGDWMGGLSFEFTKSPLPNPTPPVPRVVCSIRSIRLRRAMHMPDSEASGAAAEGKRNACAIVHQTAVTII